MPSCLQTRSRRRAAGISNGDPEVAAGPVPSLRVEGASGVLLIGVRVSPSATRTSLRGLYGDRLKVSVSAPPEDNRANNALEEALAGWLGLRRDQIAVETGRSSRDKIVAIKGMAEMELRRRLAGLLP